MKILCILALFGSVPAFAQETAQEAEMARLFEEMDRLAKKNAWSGVERAYQQAVELGEVSLQGHLLGSQAARVLGNTFDAVRRLQRARSLDDSEKVRADLDALEAAFARVKVSSDSDGLTLTPAAIPFAPDQRASIEYAQQRLAEVGTFVGMLPLGSYTVGASTFTLDGTGGASFVEVVVAPVVAEATPRRERQPKPEHNDDGGLAVGPLVLLGGGFTASPAPPPGDDLTLLAPGDTGFGQAMITAGVELSAGIIGGALAANFAPGFGASRFSQLGGWAALVVRPGPLHVAVGPSYQFFWGRGEGLAPWLDRGQDPAQDLSTVKWAGQARAFGVRGDIGVVLTELGPLGLLVSAGGGFHSDGDRSFMGGGVSVGLVPAQ